MHKHKVGVCFGFGFAVDWIKKPSLFPLKMHSKNVFFFQQENRLQEETELIHSVSRYP